MYIVAIQMGSTRVVKCQVQDSQFDYWYDRLKECGAMVLGWEQVPDKPVHEPINFYECFTDTWIND